MDDGFRMDDNVNLFGTDTKQPPRLDDLQPLVHQRRRVDGDSAPHPPYWMLQGLLRTYGIEEPPGGFEKWPSRRRQDDSLDFLGLPGAQALVDGAVLAINGEHLDSPFGGGAHYQFPGGHQRLFV